jgi:uncharacterized RDD family membrane protein YckC
VKDSRAKLDNRVWVTTPEQIRFQYETVGGLKRAVALLLDLIFITMLVVAVYVVLSILTGLVAIALSLSGQGGAMLANALLGLSSGFYLVFLFVIWWFYGVLLEYRYGGRTWGKMCLGIRVLSLDGRTPTFSQCVWRNFLRLADGLPFFPAVFFFPADYADWWTEETAQTQSIIQQGFAFGALMPTFAAAILSMMLTSRNQRIGDLFAGTMVIKSQSYGVPNVPVFHDIELLSLANQIPRNFSPGRELVETLSLYVSRRQRFIPARRREIAARLSPCFAAEFGLPATTDPDLLLGAVYLRAVCDPVQLSGMYEEALRRQSLTQRRSG